MSCCRVFVLVVAYLGVLQFDLNQSAPVEPPSTNAQLRVPLCYMDWFPMYCYPMPYFSFINNKRKNGNNRRVQPNDIRISIPTASQSGRTNIAIEHRKLPNETPNYNCKLQVHDKTKVNVILELTNNKGDKKDSSQTDNYNADAIGFSTTGPNSENPRITGPNSEAASENDTVITNAVYTKTSDDAAAIVFVSADESEQNNSDAAKTGYRINKDYTADAVTGDDYTTIKEYGSDSTSSVASVDDDHFGASKSSTSKAEFSFGNSSEDDVGISSTAANSWNATAAESISIVTIDGDAGKEAASNQYAADTNSDSSAIENKDAVAEATEYAAKRDYNNGLSEGAEVGSTLEAPGFNGNSKSDFDDEKSIISSNNALEVESKIRTNHDGKAHTVTGNVDTTTEEHRVAVDDDESKLSNGNVAEAKSTSKVTHSNGDSQFGSNSNKSVITNSAVTEGESKFGTSSTDTTTTRNVGTTAEKSRSVSTNSVRTTGNDDYDSSEFTASDAGSISGTPGFNVDNKSGFNYDKSIIISGSAVELEPKIRTSHDRIAHAATSNVDTISEEHRGAVDDDVSKLSNGNIAETKSTSRVTNSNGDNQFGSDSNKSVITNSAVTEVESKFGTSSTDTTTTGNVGTTAEKSRSDSTNSVRTTGNDDYDSKEFTASDAGSISGTPSFNGDNKSGFNYDKSIIISGNAVEVEPKIRTSHDGIAHVATGNVDTISEEHRDAVNDDVSKLSNGNIAEAKSTSRVTNSNGGNQFGSDSNKSVITNSAVTEVESKFGTSSTDTTTTGNVGTTAEKSRSDSTNSFRTTGNDDYDSKEFTASDAGSISGTPGFNGDNKSGSNYDKSIIISGSAVEVEPKIRTSHDGIANAATGNVDTISEEHQGAVDDEVSKLSNSNIAEAKSTSRVTNSNGNNQFGSDSNKSVITNSAVTEVESKFGTSSTDTTTTGNVGTTAEISRSDSTNSVRTTGNDNYDPKEFTVSDAGSISGTPGFNGDNKSGFNYDKSIIISGSAVEVEPKIRTSHDGIAHAATGNVDTISEEHRDAVDDDVSKLSNGNIAEAKSTSRVTNSNGDNQFGSDSNKSIITNSAVTEVESKFGTSSTDTTTTGNVGTTAEKSRSDSTNSVRTTGNDDYDSKEFTASDAGSISGTPGFNGDNKSGFNYDKSIIISGSAIEVEPKIRTSHDGIAHAATGNVDTTSVEHRVAVDDDDSKLSNANVAEAKFTSRVTNSNGDNQFGSDSNKSVITNSAVTEAESKLGTSSTDTTTTSNVGTTAEKSRSDSTNSVRTTGNDDYDSKDFTASDAGSISGTPGFNGDNKSGFNYDKSIIISGSAIEVEPKIRTSHDGIAHAATGNVDTISEEHRDAVDDDVSKLSNGNIAEAKSTSRVTNSNGDNQFGSDSNKSVLTNGAVTEVESKFGTSSTDTTTTGNVGTTAEKSRSDSTNSVRTSGNDDYDSKEFTASDAGSISGTPGFNGDNKSGFNYDKSIIISGSAVEVEPKIRTSHDGIAHAATGNVDTISEEHRDAVDDDVSKLSNGNIAEAKSTSRVTNSNGDNQFGSDSNKSVITNSAVAEVESKFGTSSTDTTTTGNIGTTAEKSRSDSTNSVRTTGNDDYDSKDFTTSDAGSISGTPGFNGDNKSGFNYDKSIIISGSAVEVEPKIRTSHDGIAHAATGNVDTISEEHRDAVNDDVSKLSNGNIAEAKSTSRVTNSNGDNQFGSDSNKSVITNSAVTEVESKFGTSSTDTTTTGNVGTTAEKSRSDSTNSVRTTGNDNYDPKEFTVSDAGSISGTPGFNGDSKSGFNYDKSIIISGSAVEVEPKIRTSHDGIANAATGNVDTTSVEHRVAVDDDDSKLSNANVAEAKFTSRVTNSNGDNQFGSDSNKSVITNSAVTEAESKFGITKNSTASPVLSTDGISGKEFRSHNTNSGITDDNNGSV